MMQQLLTAINLCCHFVLPSQETHIHTYRKSKQQTGLSNARITNQQQLEQVVTVNVTQMRVSTKIVNCCTAADYLAVTPIFTVCQNALAHGVQS